MYSCRIRSLMINKTAELLTSAHAVFNWCQSMDEQLLRAQTLNKRYALLSRPKMSWWSDHGQTSNRERVRAPGTRLSHDCYLAMQFANVKDRPNCSISCSNRASGMLDCAEIAAARLRALAGVQPSIPIVRTQRQQLAVETFWNAISRSFVASVCSIH